MPFCIKYSEYKESVHDIVFGPFGGPCEVCGVVTPASVLMRFNGGSGDEEGGPVLFGDVVFSVFNESVPGLVVSIEYLGPNMFLVLIDPSFDPDLGPARFQIRLADRRYSYFNVEYTLAERRAYTSDVSIDPPVAELVHDPITLDTLEYVVGWNGRYWASRRAGGSIEDFSPPHPGQISGAFNPFGHALYEIHRVNDLDGIGLEGLYAYVDGHLDEFAGYTLDLGLAVRFFIEGVPAVVDLDEFRALATDGRDLLENLNPFGVNHGTYRCMMLGPPKGKGPLYKSTRYRGTVDFNPDPLNNGGDDFDCRSFSESACVFLRQQLAVSCPKAKVGIYGVPGHAMNWVDLGGDPKPCCEGYFILEPQSGKVYKDRKAYCLAKGLYPCEGFQFDVGYDFDNSTSPYEPTQWSENPKELERITNILCSCARLEAPGGTAESLIKEQCDAGTISDWFVRNYNYGAGTDNGPSKTSPTVSGMPQIFGCDRYKCVEGGCVKDSDGTLTEYECDKFCKERWNCAGFKSCESVGYRVSTQFFGSEEDCNVTCLSSSPSSSTTTTTTTPEPTTTTTTPEPTSAPAGACCIDSGPQGAPFISCINVTKLACDESKGIWGEGQACDFDESLGTYRNCDCVLACPKSDVRPGPEGSGCLCCPEPEPHYCEPSNTCYGCDEGFVPKASSELGFCYCLCNKDDSVCPAGTKLNRLHGTDTYCKCDPIGGCCTILIFDGVPSFTCQDSIKAECPDASDQDSFPINRFWSANACDKDPCRSALTPTPTPEPTTITTPAPTPTPVPTTPAPTTTTPVPTTPAPTTTTPVPCSAGFKYNQGAGECLSELYYCQ